MLKYHLMLCATLMALLPATAQVSTVQPEFDASLQRLLSETVPYIDVDTLATRPGDYLIVDVRALEEFEVSHIPGARFLAEIEAIDQLAASTDTRIVLYCSVGYRSEKLGEKLQARGYRNVYNLYGSIFEWANRNYPLHNGNSLPTDSLHVYSKRWSKWVDRPNLIKVW